MRYLLISMTVVGALVWLVGMRAPGARVEASPVAGHCDAGVVPGHCDSGVTSGHCDAGVVPGHCDAGVSSTLALAVRTGNILKLNY